MNSLWEGLLSTSMSLAIIGFICKLFLTHIDKRGIENYKVKLKLECDQRIINDEREYNLKKARDLEVGRWRLTLLSAANGILGRLLHIKKNDDLISDPYYLDSTKYYLCQYLYWAQLFRKNRDSSVFSPSSDELIISDLLKNISILIRSNDLGFPVIRSLEQQYIGDSFNVNDTCVSYKFFLDSEVLVNYEVLDQFIEALLQRRSEEYIDTLIGAFNDLTCYFCGILQK
ncbi:hypothetical protein ACS25B_06120 [Dickeya dadantii subsp. dieffenbachiae]|uniref:hypothetical protein n=1 Tax=Dickeya dadantii TaxID=204038 RepID=UPI0005765418|nr:hypothetical protein [Dickeya dadantii]